jgi:hypothetical protein
LHHFHIFWSLNHFALKCLLKIIRRSLIS